MDNYLIRPLPLITSRVEFALQPVGPLPVITYRMDFTTLSLKTPDGDVPVISINENDSDLELEDNISDVEMDDRLLLAGPSTPDDRNGDDDCSTTASEDDHQVTISTEKIRKPPGEPGRPGSGGYSLEKEIASWGPETITKVNAFVRTRADNSLEIIQSYGKQKPLEIKKICVEAAKHYPIVNKYYNQWPVRDMLKAYLKTTSAAYRQEMKSKAVTQKQKGKAREV